MPINYKKYPENWKTEIRPAILKRAKNSCEICGLKNYILGYRDKTYGFIEIENSIQGETDAFDAIEDGYKIIKIVLTIAHLDHNILNNDYSNLKALCQKCHLNHDKHLHIESRKFNRDIKNKQIKIGF